MMDQLDIFRKVAVKAEPTGPLSKSIKRAQELAETTSPSPGVSQYNSIEENKDLMQNPRDYARRLARSPEFAEMDLSLREKTYWLHQLTKKWAKRAREQGNSVHAGV